MREKIIVKEENVIENISNYIYWRNTVLEKLSADAWNFINEML